MNIIYGVANLIINDANKDEELRVWFKSLATCVRKARRIPILTFRVISINTLDYYRRSFFNPATSSSPTVAAAVIKISPPTASSTMGNTKPTLFSSIGAYFGAMGEDPTNNEFGEDWVWLTKVTCSIVREVCSL